MSDNEIEAAQQQQMSNNEIEAAQQQQVEDDEVTISMKNMIQHCGEDPLLSWQRCIYRVPPVIRKHNDWAYIPKLVSIGPLHYGMSWLNVMERQKQILFKRFACKAGSGLDDLVHLVKNSLPNVRASYSEVIRFTDQELVKLILTDAGFIIELFTQFDEWQRVFDDAKLPLPPGFWSYIAEDLLLLENQLPIFIIEKLFKKAFPRNNHKSFPRLAYGYFKYFYPQHLKPYADDGKINHFTDILRYFYLHGNKSRRTQSAEAGRHILLYNANALQEKGIKLKASDCNRMEFSKHILEIPQICVEAGTELLFHNMIALEQFHYPYNAYITDFALVLDCLIDSYKDVDLLVSKKIVRNYLGDSHNVASLFNGLRVNVTRNFNSEYLDICKRLNEYCQDPCIEMKATLRRDYCRTPWQIVASIAAIVLLLLTVVQTIFSILQVVK